MSRHLLLALVLAVSAGAAAAQSEPATGQGYVWNGTRWVAVSVSLPAVQTPVAAPASTLPARNTQTVLRPSWLLGVFR